MLTNPLMRTVLIEVNYIFPDDPLYMPAIMEENVIQAFSAQTADEPFANPIRTRRSIWHLEFLDT
jgi:hypothetical protein